MVYRKLTTTESRNPMTMSGHRLASFLFQFITNKSLYYNVNDKMTNLE